MITGVRTGIKYWSSNAGSFGPVKRTQKGHKHWERRTKDIRASEYKLQDELKNNMNTNQHKLQDELKMDINACQKNEKVVQVL
jgi:hypothetical protein